MVGTLGDIARLADAASIASPAVILIGGAIGESACEADVLQDVRVQSRRA